MIASTIIATLVAGWFSFAPMPHPVAATPAHSPVPAMVAPVAPGLADLFTSEEGKFSIAIPAGYSEPELESNNVDSDIGEIKLYLYTAVNMAEGVCLIGYSDMAIDMTDDLKMEMLEGAKEGAISNMGATLQSEEDISLNGHPGRSIRFTTDNEGTPMRGRMDYYMVDNRLYQVGYIEIGNSAMDGTEVQNYFKSFKLTPVAKSVTPKEKGKK